MTICLKTTCSLKLSSIRGKHKKPSFKVIAASVFSTRRDGTSAGLEVAEN